MWATFIQGFVFIAVFLLQYWTCSSLIKLTGSSPKKIFHFKLCWKKMVLHARRYVDGLPQRSIKSITGRGIHQRFLPRQKTLPWISFSDRQSGSFLPTTPVSSPPHPLRESFLLLWGKKEGGGCSGRPESLSGSSASTAQKPDLLPNNTSPFPPSFSSHAQIVSCSRSLFLQQWVSCSLQVTNLNPG